MQGRDEQGATRAETDGLARVAFHRRMFQSVVRDIQRLVFRYDSGDLTEAQLVVWLEQALDAMESLLRNDAIRQALSRAETLTHRDVLASGLRRLRASDDDSCLDGSDSSLVTRDSRHGPQVTAHDGSDSGHGPQVTAPDSKERREKEEARKREERNPSSSSNSKEVQAHSGDGLENTKCSRDSSNSSAERTACPSVLSVTEEPS